MHFLGIAGMPRRIPDYPDAFSFWNYVASFGSYVTFMGLGIFFFNIFLSLITPFVLHAATFKDENLVRTLYIQEFLDDNVGLDFYDLFFFVYIIYKNDDEFFFFNAKKKRFLDWIYLFLYSFIFFEVLLRSFPLNYNYSNYYQNFQNIFYSIENFVNKISGKEKQEQKFLDFFSNLRN